jgi:quercetin dioxygenase-like cupin family protein
MFPNITSELLGGFTMRRLYVLGLVVLAAIALTAGTTKKPAQDPIAVGPNIYRLILENERVRVMEARFKPGEKIAAHTHPDHVLVVTAAGKLAITNASGTREIDAKVGDAFFIPAETHSAQNVGTTEFVGVVTELKGKSKPKDQASPNPGTTDVQQGKVDG